MPSVTASSPLSLSSPAAAHHSDWHCQGQMASGGGTATAQTGSRIILMEDEVKLGRSSTDRNSPGTLPSGTPSFTAPLLNIEDDWSRPERPKEDGVRVIGVGGVLGSAGQSPSSPLSSHSSPTSTSPSPSLSSGRLLSNSFGQSDIRRKTEGFYLQGSPKAFQGHVFLPGPNQVSQHQEKIQSNPSISRDTVSTETKKEDEKTSGSPLKTQKEESNASKLGNQILKPYLGKSGSDATSPSMSDLTGNKAGSTVGHTAHSPEPLSPSNRAAGNPVLSFVGGNRSDRENSRHSGTEITATSVPQNRNVTNTRAVSPGLEQALNRFEDLRNGSCTTTNREIQTAKGNDIPQRTAVRRAMSDCSHLSVPMVMAGAYPTGMAVTQVMAPSTPDFNPLGIPCPPRAPYPHVAVRRSLTVTDGTEVSASMAAMISTPLMMSPVVPSSPPPKRHHGSCETNVLLPVPTPVGTLANSKQDSMKETDGKIFFLYDMCFGSSERQKQGVTWQI